MGESDKPLLRYSTAEMARNTIDLLHDIGWRAEGQLHIVSVSMSLMVAQELVRPAVRFRRILGTLGMD